MVRTGWAEVSHQLRIVLILPVQSPIARMYPLCIYHQDIFDNWTDLSSGKVCITTPPTSQFQCDMGASPEPGFSVGCDGTLSLNGSSQFYECPTGDNNEYNIYVTAPSGQTGCFEITLGASSCQSGCSSSAAAPASTAAPSPSASSAAAPTPSASSAPKTCPAALTGNYQYPHLIIPVSSSSPNTAEGTSYNGTITPTTSSIFNFDIPTSYAGQTCSLIFLLPESSQLETSAYSLSGSGAIDFASLNGVATQSTTYANAPAVATDYGATTVAPGGSYTIATFSCPAGEAVSYELSSSGGTDLEYFQDYNPSA